MKIKKFTYFVCFFVLVTISACNSVDNPPETPINPSESDSDCVDYAAQPLGIKPATWRVGRTVIASGNHEVTSQPEVIELGLLSGLNVGHRTVATLLIPAPRVDVSIVSASATSVIRALNRLGIEVARAEVNTPPGMPQTLSLIGDSISSVEIISKEPHSLLLKLCALGRNPDAPLIEFVPDNHSIDVKAMFDAPLYHNNDELSITVLLPAAVTSNRAEYAAVISSPTTGDLEAIQLTTTKPGIYEGNGINGNTLTLSFTEGQEQFDGQLHSQPGELITVMVFSPGSLWATAGIDASLLSGHAVVVDLGVQTTSEVVLRPELAGIVGLMGANDPREPAAITSGGAVPIVIPTRELIFYPTSTKQEKLFLDRVGGTVLIRQLIEVAEHQPPSQIKEALLVSIDPDRLLDLQDVSSLRAKLDVASGQLYASNERVSRLYGTVLGLRLQGFLVAVNPRLEQQGTFVEEDRGSHTASMISAAGSVEHEADRGRPINGPVIPGCIPDSKTSCILNVPYLWRETALLDVDENLIRVAVLDTGFSVNEDFRGGVTSDQCFMNYPFGIQCGRGVAEGPQQVGNSLFGGKTWHGTGVVTTLGGVLGNEKSVGVGGQVVRPVLYSFNLGSYAFDIGLAVRHAVEQNNVSCINISAGYPCTIVTSIGPDIGYCSPGERLAICATVTAALFTSATAVCAATAGLSAIPIVGPILAPAAIAACAAANISAITASTTCLGTTTFGDVRGTLHSSIQFAESRGVPVITISGNDLGGSGAVPEILSDIVDLGNNDMQAWQIIPGVFPETITVSAVDGSNGHDLTNQHFQGAGIDVWAPIRSTFFRPPNGDVNVPPIDHRAGSLGGTSAAAPYVAGVVALMQAANPQLNPQTPEGRARLGQIVRDVRTNLSNTAFTDGELVAAGYTTDTDRRLVINPLGAFEAAIISQVPAQSLGYSRTFDRFDVPSGQYQGNSIFSINSLSALASAAGLVTSDLLISSLDVPLSFAYLFPSAEIAAMARLPHREPGVTNPAAWALYRAADIVGTVTLSADRVILPFPGNDTDISAGVMHRILRASLDTVTSHVPAPSVAIIYGVDPETGAPEFRSSVNRLAGVLANTFLVGPNFLKTYTATLVPDTNLASLASYDAVIVTGTADSDKIATIAVLNRPILVWAGQQGKNITALGLAVGPGDTPVVAIPMGMGSGSISGTMLDSDDWLALQAEGGARTINYEVTLRTPGAGGRSTLLAGGLTEVSRGTNGAGRLAEQSVIFRTPNLLPGATYPIEVGGNDNVYRVSFGNPEFGPEVGPDRFDSNNPVSTPLESRPDNNVVSRAARLGEVGGEAELEWSLGVSRPPFVLEWVVSPATTPAGTEIPLNFHNDSDEDWFVLIDPPQIWRNQCNTSIWIDNVPSGVSVQIFRQGSGATLTEIFRPSGELRYIFRTGTIRSEDIVIRFARESIATGTFLTYSPLIRFRTSDNDSLPPPVRCR